MILAFEFHYISQNALLENLLETICEEFDIHYAIGKSKNIITLKVEADEQRLTTFSDFLSQRLSLSIFFKSTAVNVVDNMSVDALEKQKFTAALPFTPKVLSQSNPLMNNEVGAKIFDAKGILLNDELYTQNYDELYTKVAKLIKNGQTVHINSVSGSHKLDKIDTNFKIDDDFVVIQLIYQSLKRWLSSKKMR